MIFLHQKPRLKVLMNKPPDLDKIEGIDPVKSINTSPIEVARILRQVKKSKVSYCGVPGYFLDMISTPVSFSMSKLFNNIFEAGLYGNYPM